MPLMRNTTLVMALLLSGPVLAGDNAAHEDSASLAAGNPLMQSSGQLLEKAKVMELKSIEILSETSQLRGRITRLRADERKLEKSPAKTTLHQSLDLLNDQLSRWQAEGASLRKHSSQLREMGLTIMKPGFQQAWPDAVKLTGPVRLEANGSGTSAHNAEVRSVHPDMHGEMTDGAPTEQEDGMSMELSASSGQQVPPNLDTGTFQPSRNLNFLAHVEPATSAEPVPRAPLNQIHSWHLMLLDPNGAPVTDARIRVGGHMPGHVHGLPTQPKATEEVSPGIYRIEGMKFQMTGWWVLELDVSQGDTTDTLIFNLVL